jgi:hypothetical protein
MRHVRQESTHMKASKHPGPELQPDSTTHHQTPTLQSEATRTQSGSLMNGALSVVILFHVIAIVAWAIPVNIAPVTAIKGMVRPYILWTGLDQAWDMFSPNPRDVNTYIKAIVITQHHHPHVWEFPRMDQLSMQDRFFQDRSRAFQELIAAPKGQPLLPEVATHIARFFNDPADPPDKVVLIEFRNQIEPGDDEFVEQTPKPNVFYDDYVDFEVQR